MYFIRIIFLLILLATGTGSQANSMRFFGTAFDGDRVKILLDTPSLPPRSANIGVTDTTIEFWVKGTVADNPSANACSGWGWIGGHILFDQDVAGHTASSPQYGAWGLSIGRGIVAYGVKAKGVGSETFCATKSVLDDAWHHVAVQRRANDGRIWIFLDGELNVTAIGPAGDASYPDNFPTTLPNSDPFTVLGAEKQGGFAWTNYKGLLTEVRFSTTLRYGTSITPGAAFTRPTQRFVVDTQTAALWHFTEGSGTNLGDATGRSPGIVVFNAQGDKPEWSAETPFSGGGGTCAVVP